MVFNTKHDWFGLKEKRRIRWIESTIYNAEHVELPQIYFGMKNDAGTEYSPKKFRDVATFLLARTIAAAGTENFEEASKRFDDEYKFEVTDRYVKVTCKAPEKYVVDKAPLAYAIYAENADPRYIVKEYDPVLKFVWCEWKPGQKHITYYMDPELRNCPDDEIHDAILRGDSGIVPATIHNYQN